MKKPYSGDPIFSYIFCWEKSSILPLCNDKKKKKKKKEKKKDKRRAMKVDASGNDKHSDFFVPLDALSAGDRFCVYGICSNFRECLTWEKYV